MKLTDNEKHEPIFDRLADWFGLGIRLILNVLIVIVTLALVVGIFKAGSELVHAFNQPLERILQNVLLDAVFILALLEITITILAYLRDGRVEVRYIVDTILIIMLNEIVTMWFKYPSLSNAIALSIIIAVLTAIRICLTKFNKTD